MKWSREDVWQTSGVWETDSVSSWTRMIRERVTVSNSERKRNEKSESKTFLCLLATVARQLSDCDGNIMAVSEHTHTGAHTQVPYEKKIFFVTTNRVGRERLKEEMETNNRGHPTRLQNDLELTTTMCAIINHFMNWERQNVRCIISLPYNRQLRFRSTKNATNPPFPQGGHVLPSLEQIKSFRGTMEMYIITGFS